MINRRDTRQLESITGYSSAAKIAFRRTPWGAGAGFASRLLGSQISRGQSAVEFAMIAPLAVIVMVVGVQCALLGQVALAVNQGASALVRYAAVNPGAIGTNGTITVTSQIEQLLSSSILTNNGQDLTISIASYSGSTTSTTSSPGYADRVTITLSYNAASKIILPNPFLGISFPTSLSASDSQMYE